MYNLDTYIKETALKEFKAKTLFILADSYSNKIQYVFQNPIEILRKYWQTHSTFFSYDESYYDTLDYLVEKTNELQYQVPAKFLDKIISNPDKATKDDINNAAFLFLVQHSALSPGLLFGYADIPEQTRLLRDALNSIGCLFVETVIQSMVFNGTDEKARSISVVMKK